MKLREIAHSRTGDKGKFVTVSVIAYKEEHFPVLVEYLTVERVSACFQDQIVSPAERYVVPNLTALNFVLRRPSSESVTRSLALDAHGKSLGSMLLDMEMDANVPAL